MTEYRLVKPYLIQQFTAKTAPTYDEVTIEPVGEKLVMSLDGLELAYAEPIPETKNSQYIGIAPWYFYKHWFYSLEKDTDQTSSPPSSTL